MSYEFGTTVIRSLTPSWQLFPYHHFLLNAVQWVCAAHIRPHVEESNHLNVRCFFHQMNERHTRRTRDLRALPNVLQVQGSLPCFYQTDLVEVLVCWCHMSFFGCINGVDNDCDGSYSATYQCLKPVDLHNAGV